MSVYVERRIFICLGCKAEFMDELLQGAVVEVFCAQLKSIHCPECGCRRIGITDKSPVDWILRSANQSLAQRPRPRPAAGKPKGSA